MDNRVEMSFWRWFLKGSGAGPGVRRLLDLWLVVHLAVGGLMALLVTEDLKAASVAVLLPLAGILIGLSFAWVGNAQALLQSREVHELAEYREGGFAEYVFAYQTAILMILFSLVLWGLAGLGIFDNQ